MAIKQKITSAFDIVKEYTSASVVATAVVAAVVDSAVVLGCSAAIVPVLAIGTIGLSAGGFYYLLKDDK